METFRPWREVVVQIARDDGPIRGWLVLEGEPRRAFHGWIELTTSLEEARAEGPRGASERAG